MFLFSKSELRVPMNSVKKTIECHVPMDKSIENTESTEKSKSWTTSDKLSKDDSYSDIKKQLEQLKITNQSNNNSSNLTSNDTQREELEFNKTLSDLWIKEKSINEASKKQVMQYEQIKSNDQPNCDLSKVSAKEDIKSEENDDPLIFSNVT